MQIEVADMEVAHDTGIAERAAHSGRQLRCAEGSTVRHQIVCADILNGRIDRSRRGMRMFGRPQRTWRIITGLVDLARQRKNWDDESEGTGCSPEPQSSIWFAAAL